MPLLRNCQLRLNGLLIGCVLCISFAGAPARLHGQQPLAISTASTSAPVESASVSVPAVSLPTSGPVANPAADLAADLPDSPGAVLFPQAQSSSSSQQSTQTPSSPGVVQSTNPDVVSPNGTQQTKRVLGIVPNFRSVSADIKLPPMSPKDKFIIAGKDTFDYSSFIIAGIQAAVSFSSGSYPEFHYGVVGYGRYYWHTLADTTGENFFVGGLGPIVFHQDNRFYTLGHGGFRKRTVYAVTRVLISRKDDGSPTFNFAEIIGSGAASGLSTLYYPKQYQTWTKVGQKWLTSDIIDGFNFFWKEWWPSVNKYAFHTH